MADMYVPMIWLPLGRVDLDAGLHAIDRLGDEGLVAALSVDSDEDPIGGWVLDLLEDLAVYDRSGPVEAPAEVVSPSQAARTFAAALSRAVDTQTAVRGLVHRMELPGGGVVLAAGGEWGGDTPVSAATLHCAIEVFPAVADAMGAIPPTRWAISALPPGDAPRHQALRCAADRLDRLDFLASADLHAVGIPGRRFALCASPRERGMCEWRYASGQVEGS